MAKSKITLYVDTVSPFAYIAYYILRHDPVFKSCDVTYIPIFLGGVMKKCGNIAPIQIKNKDKWSGMERIRWAKAFSVPICDSMPEGFPPLTLSIMRTLCALSLLDPSQEKLCWALDALYQAFWVESKPTQKPEVMVQVLKQVLGEEESNKVVAMAQKEGKELLLENTDKAYDAGAFGLPWFTCTNTDGKVEGFWGVDHLGQIADFLGIETPKMGGWKAVL